MHRIFVTGAATWTGGRLIQRLEQRAAQLKAKLEALQTIMARRAGEPKQQAAKLESAE